MKCHWNLYSRMYEIHDTAPLLDIIGAFGEGAPGGRLGASHNWG